MNEDRRDDRADQLTLSVAMCTYNGGQYLGRQLATISRQTIPPKELVVCDDRSSDDTLAQLRAFAKAASFPVHIYVNERQLGAAQNFGECLSRCNGDIVVLTDQDDLWVKDRLERTRDAFSLDPTLSYTFSDAELVDEHGHALGRMISDSVPVLSADRARLRDGRGLLPVILRYGVLYGTTMAVRRREALQVLPVPALWSHDEWLSLTLSATGRSARLAPVTQYRQHAAQIVGAGNARLTTTLASARHRSSEHYEREAERMRTGLAAATENRLLATALAPSLEKKLRFIEDRRRLHGGGVVAMPTLLRQVVIGGYRRYAAGSRSILKDVTMMIAATRGGA